MAAAALLGRCLGGTRIDSSNLMVVVFVVFVVAVVTTAAMMIY